VKVGDKKSGLHLPTTQWVSAKKILHPLTVAMRLAGLEEEVKHCVFGELIWQLHSSQA